MSRQDVAKFSYFLWKWMSDSKKTELLHQAILRAFEEYNENLRLAAMPFGDPGSFLDDEVFPILFNFDAPAFRNLVDYFRSIQSTLAQPKKGLVDRILDIGKFDEQFKRWTTAEFSKEEFDILKEILQRSPENAVLLEKLLSRNNECVQQDSVQFYLHQAKAIAEKVGDVASHARNVMKSAAATAYSAVISYAIPNAAMAYQHQPELFSEREFIFSLKDTHGWRHETNARLPNGFASLNVRIMNAISREFYFDHVVSSDVSAGSLEERGVVDGDSYLLIHPIDDDGKLVDEKLASNQAASLGAIGAEESAILKLFITNAISPLQKEGHALALHQGLLALECQNNLELKKESNVGLNASHNPPCFFSASAPVAGGGAAVASSQGDWIDSVLDYRAGDPFPEGLPSLVAFRAGFFGNPSSSGDAAEIPQMSGPAPSSDENLNSGALP